MACGSICMIKFRLFALLLLASRVFADCNSVAIYACTIDSNCPINGTVNAGTWYSNCGAGFCAPDCHWHQPTYGCPNTLTYNGVCGGPAGCQATMTVGAFGCSACGAVADCVNTIATCTLGACPAWTPWANQGCALNGCAAGQMSQSSNGSGAACCGPTIQHRCVADPTCAPPTVTSFTASPLTVALGDPVTFSWTLGGGPPTSESLDQGVGVVIGNSVVTTPGVTGILTYTLTVTNGMGTVTASVPVTITPPAPRCGLGNICGYVRAEERPAQVLPEMPVILRSSSPPGRVIRTKMTDSSGFYSFTGLASGTYYARAEPNRTWRSAPNNRMVSPNNIIGTVDFTMLFVPAIVTVTGTPGTFLAFTTIPILTPRPPDGNTYMSAVIDLDNKRQVELRTGIYYMTCWKLNKTALPYTWGHGPSQLINGGAQLWPQDQITETCL